MDRLDELVFLAIGRAQMCWKEFPTSTPDDERAYEVGKQLVAAIREYKQEEAQKPVQPPAPTYIPYPVYPYNPLIPQRVCGTKQIEIKWDAGTATGNYTTCNPKGY